MRTGRPPSSTYPLLGREGDATFPAQSMPLFGKATILRVDGSRIPAATNDAFEIAEYDAVGALQRLIRLLSPRRAVSDADHAEYVAQELRGHRRAERGRARSLPGAMAHGIARAARLDGFPLPRRSARRRGRCALGRGLSLAPGRSPALLRLRCGGTARCARANAAPVSPGSGARRPILALWRDADDIEHVRIYRVRR
jgi:hypothetical protein